MSLSSHALCLCEASHFCKNYLHFGSDSGGSRPAIICGLVGTSKLNGVGLYAYLRHVLGRFADRPINPVDELLPWVVASQLGTSTQNLQRAT